MKKLFFHSTQFHDKGAAQGNRHGLAVVHGIVKSYGGGITVESTPGRGTSVFVFFPRVAEPGEPETQSGESIAPGSESILLVDDEEPTVISLQAQLSSLGYHVSAEQDSRQALAAFKENPISFDLVITDQTMPHMTGYEFSREMLAIRRLLPIILCTGYSEKVDEGLAKAAGIRGVVMKPLSMQDLSSAIRAVLDT